MKIGATRPMPA